MNVEEMSIPQYLGLVFLFDRVKKVLGKVALNLLYKEFVHFLMKHAVSQLIKNGIFFVRLTYLSNSFYKDN
jgi:hypothetical protein